MLAIKLLHQHPPCHSPAAVCAITASSLRQAHLSLSTMLSTPCALVLTPGQLAGATWLQAVSGSTKPHVYGITAQAAAYTGSGGGQLQRLREACFSLAWGL